MRRLKSRNSQVRVQEMIFMLIGLTVFFAIVLLFFLSFSLNGLKKDVQASSRQGSILLVSRLAASPEFECAETDIALCVDADKVIALMNYAEYKRFWKVQSLKIEKIYPPSNNTVQCSLNNYPNCNTYTIINNNVTGIIEDASYITLCRKEYKNGYPYNLCELGKMIIGTSTSIGA